MEWMVVLLALSCSLHTAKARGNGGKWITWQDILTLNAPIATKVVCFSHLLKCLRSLYGKQSGPIGAVCSGSTLFASILNLSGMVGFYLQQTTFSDAFFSWRFKH